MADDDAQSVSRRKFLEGLGIAGGAVMLHDGASALGVSTSPAHAQAPAATGNGPHVVILGGGVGGLTAAYRLLELNRGYRCTVLEANPKVGGRCLTLRPGNKLIELRGGEEWEQTCDFASEPDEPYKPYLNAGPGRIPSGHKAVLDLCKELRVALEVYVMESRSNLIRRGDAFGRATVVDRQIANDTRGWIAHHLYPLVERLGLEPAQVNLLRALLIKFGDLQKEGPAIGTYRGSSRSGYAKLPGVYEGTLLDPLKLPDLLASGFWAPDGNFYQPEEFLWQTTSFQPVGGMDMIVQALETKIRALGGVIRTGAEVTRIWRERNAIRVLYKGARDAETADACISNMPMPLLYDRLQRQDFSAPFIESLAAVTRAPGFLAPTCKVGWQARRNLWQSAPGEGQVPIFGGISRTSHEINQMWYPSDRFHDEFGVLTGAYNMGAVAERWGELKPAQRIEIAREGAATIGGPAFAAGLGKGITIAWQNMPFQRGGWVDWSKVPGGTAVYNTLLKGDPGFFVCGDQLSQLVGWQEGAVLSAHHVVKQITQRGFVAPEIRTLPDTPALVGG